MEVYILDRLYRRSAVVDMFESVIWTERWAEVGDFELLISSTPVNRNLFTAGTAVALNASKRVMLVETIEDNTDDDGRTRLKIKGRSLEKILADRMLIDFDGLGVPKEKLYYPGTPLAIAQMMFTHVCVNGVVNDYDVIPLYTTGTSYSAETIAAPTETILWEPEPANLLTLLQDICKVYEFGFRLYRNGDAGQLYFNVYTGNDRTTAQRVHNPTIFSPGLETVQNTTRLATIEKEKNVAYVFNEQGFEIVYADGVDPTVDGFYRRVLTVKVGKFMVTDALGNQVEPTATELSNHLIEQGKNELAKNQSLLAFDGEVNQHSPYLYGRDYELGDLVEMRDADGVGSNMRVTEQIFVHDGAGERSYPTLTLDSYIVTGTWDFWIGNKYWTDFGATEYWNTQP